MVFIAVDCQPRYFPFGERLDALVGEIKSAMQAGTPIALLRYVYGGDIYEHILDLVRGYDKCIVVDKDTFGGGKQLIAAARKCGWDLSKVRIGGACTYCCVSETSEQLLGELPDTVQEVASNACYDTYYGGPFPRHENIRWV